jgi:membrane protease YdiL (CAAX protease family)
LPATIAALVFPTLMAWAYFVGLSVEGEGANPAFQAAYALGKVMQFSWPVLCFLVWERRWPWPSKPRVAGLTIGLGFGLIVAVLIVALYYGLLSETSVFRAMPDRLRSKVEQFDAATPARFLVLAAFLTLIHSLLEEYYWRWFVFGCLRKVMSFWTAATVSSVGFMAHHVIVLAVYMPGHFCNAVLPLSSAIAIGAVVWAWLYDRSGSIYATWVSHACVDAALMLVGYVMLFGR